MSIEKLCECGCKLKVKTILARFLPGHNQRNRIGTKNSNWKGGKSKRYDGHISIRNSGHARSNAAGYVQEHILIIEKYLNKPLPINAVIHHFNGNKSDNRPENLIVCQNQAYHLLLHQRQRAHEAYGHANWIKCKFCGQHDDPNLLFLVPNTNQGYHRQCHSIYEANRRKRLKEQACGRVGNDKRITRLTELITGGQK